MLHCTASVLLAMSCLTSRVHGNVRDALAMMPGDRMLR